MTNIVGKMLSAPLVVIGTCYGIAAVAYLFIRMVIDQGDL